MTISEFQKWLRDSPSKLAAALRKLTKATPGQVREAKGIPGKRAVTTDDFDWWYLREDGE